MSAEQSPEATLEAKTAECLALKERLRVAENPDAPSPADALQTQLYKELLAAERHKLQDALAEKKQYQTALDSQQQEITELKDQQHKSEEQAKHWQSAFERLNTAKTETSDDLNLDALSDHLRSKQRTIEGLISEKAHLAMLLEKEVLPN